ncbi:hypothetical protein Phpb_01867 [Photorhabdus namnaonensis]|uniref:Uncharacterized protein n=1 Tax=Photorhabdus namnaonensis TaxID=1851568 RepID=A0A1B8YIV2_9GAMM|nr:hypothetical protein Phpb_01867 [Photorhabdus namnaonensis]
MAVIEDHSLFIHVKLTVGIVGNAVGAGGLDIDLRRTVGAANDGRLLAPRRLSVGHNRRLRGERNPAKGE